MEISDLNRKRPLMQCELEEIAKNYDSETEADYESDSSVELSFDIENISEIQNNLEKKL